MIPGSQLKDMRAEARTFLSRAWVLFAIAVVMTLVLVGRLFQLQVLEHEVYQTRSEHNRIEVQPVAAGRGLIYDRHGVLLAENRSVSSLEIVEERSLRRSTLFGALLKFKKARSRRFTDALRENNDPTRPLH